MAQYDVKTALLGAIIDYAGTFPPAALSLDKALQRAATFRREGKHPWIYKRVALPLDDLKKLNARMLYQAGADGSPWIFTALGSAVPSPAPSEFLRCVEWDLREIRRCQERWAEGPLTMQIVGYETKLPTLDRSQMEDYLSPALDRFAVLTGGNLTPYLEMPWEGEWSVRLSALTAILTAWCEENSESGVIPAIKVRTGGQFTPSPAQLAAVVSGCVAHGLRFKATQGLHATVTHGKDFGFVNLFVALALAPSVDVETIEQVLSCENESDFKWESNALLWKDHRLEIESIEAARRVHGGCFGSCSLDEPDEALEDT